MVAGDIGRYEAQSALKPDPRPHGLLSWMLGSCKGSAMGPYAELLWS